MLPGARRIEGAVHALFYRPGKTLLQLWASKANRTPKLWNDFYSSIDPARKPQQRGVLPFRVAQLYDVVVAAVKNKSLAEYVCAAGVLAHYVGDACQPLHVSFLHHSETDDDEDDGVHAAYEDDIVSVHAPLVVAGVKRLVDAARPFKPIVGAAEAADAVVQLMRRTVARLPPEDILAAYNANRGPGQSKAMWAALGERTLKRMADGAVTLAAIWQSAWTEGGGDVRGRFIKTALARPVAKAALKKLYDNNAFAESSEALLVAVEGSEEAGPRAEQLARAAPAIGSTLTTSAPRSARISLQVGPITMCVNSTTRSPVSGSWSAGIMHILRSLRRRVARRAACTRQRSVPCVMTACQSTRAITSADRPARVPSPWWRAAGLRAGYARQLAWRCSPAPCEARSRRARPGCRAR